jgi:uncharacterized protein (TIRG00374 family)
MNIPMKKSLQVAVALTLTTLLLVYVVDFDDVVRTLRNCDPWWALATIAVISVDRTLMSYKWGLLLRVRGHRLALLDGLMIYCSAMVWGLALPSTVGADAIRAGLVKRRGVDITDSVATIIVERAIGFVCALLMGAMSLVTLHFLLPHVMQYNVPLFTIAASMLAAVAVLLLSFSGRAYDVLRGMLPQSWRASSVLERVDRLHGTYRSLAADRRIIVAFVGLTLVQQCFSIVVPWFVTRTLELEVNALYLIAAAPLAFLFARLPVSFDGIGVYEAIFVSIMTLSGMHPAQSFAVALAGRVLNLVAWLPWFAAYTLGTRGRAAIPAVSTRASDTAPVQARATTSGSIGER